MQPQTIRDVLAWAALRLTQAGCDMPGLDAEVLLAHTLGQERTWLYMYPQHRLSPTHLARFNQLLTRRERREPVAYLTGHKEFFGLDFQVNRHVLIPRPETELLVETALELFEPYSTIEIADVGTGSGCLAVTLAKHLPQTTLMAIDASDKALALAQLNAVQHQVDDRITFSRGDLLQPLDHPVDMIVSNPPYVSRAELTETSPEVRLYEPRLALEAGDDGLEVIRRLLPQASQKLKSGGALLVEIGSSQGERVAQLASYQFPQAEIHIKKDLAQLDRLLVVTRPNSA